MISTEFPSRVSTMFSMLESSLAAGSMIGPAIGGGLYELGGFRLPFWVIGAMVITNSFLIMLFLPRATAKVPVQDRRAILKLLKSPLVWVALLIAFTGAFGVIFLEPTLTINLAQFCLSAFESSLFFVIIPFLYAAMAPVYGFISDRWNIQAPLMMASCVTCAIGFLMLGPSPLIPVLPNAVWFKVLAMVVLGGMFSCCIVFALKCMILGAKEVGLPNNLDTFGLISGVFHSVFYLGAFLGPTFGGIMMDTIGFEFGTTAVAAMFLAMFVVQAVFFGHRRLRGFSEREPLIQ
ncbi:hypothetical protein EGW08_002992 [Elysia chlorotica]|uniref:Major facilitator superfamily (MFS) profile domain-containing protein n=1 Tax=Elysia chlorotica TaxID=188477 RepID=A0A433U5X6_ELYCH|nr:hypothetical protein EGW08_002992 [Elysia chlorotica]